MSTHAHFKEEFGPRKLRIKKVLQKDPRVAAAPQTTRDVSSHAAKAERFSNIARESATAHARAKKSEDRTIHEATVAHAASRAAVHAKYVVKNAPHSDIADKATLHAQIAKTTHEKLVQNEAPKAEKSKSEAQSATDRASAASEAAHNATPEDRKRAHEAAAEAHGKAAEAHDKEGNTDARNTHWDKQDIHTLTAASQKQTQTQSKSADNSHDSAHVESSVTQALHEARLSSQALRDGDIDKAKEHADKAADHAKIVESARPTETKNRLSKEFEASNAARLADSGARYAKQDEADGEAKKLPPEKGGLKAAEYDAMSDKFSAGLSSDQRAAVRAYTDHTDRILNSMLREHSGHVDNSTKLYSGSHATDDVHQERAVKRAGLIHDKRFGIHGAYGSPGDFQNHGHGDLTAKKEIHDLDAAIASHKLDKDALVYRTMSDPGGSITGKLTPGASFTDHAYVSTSADRNFIDSFYKDSGFKISGKVNRTEDRVDFHVQLRSGHTAAPMASESAGYKSGESEMLLPRGSKFRVTKIVEASGGAPKQVHVELEQ